MLLSPERAVYHRLITSPGVARLVGFKVFPVAVGKDASFPFIVYRRLNIPRQSSLNGPIYEPEVNLQIACWAMTHDESRELADEVRLALNGHTGSIVGVTIHDMRMVSETDDYLDPSQVGAELPPAYETRQLYQIRWTESDV